MTDVTVDGSVFRFPDGWEIEAYDSWKQAAKLAGGALKAKACDIVAIDTASEILYLIEAKDYTYPKGTRTPGEGRRARRSEGLHLSEGNSHTEA